MGFMLAKLRLAWGFFLHFCSKLCFWRRSGYAQFARNYFSEGLVPLSVVDRAGLLQFSRCIHCACCDLACPALEKLPREKFPGPSVMMMALTRSALQRPQGLDFTYCQGCQRCEDYCPTQVPIKAALEFLEVRAKGLALEY